MISLSHQKDILNNLTNYCDGKIELYEIVKVRPKYYLFKIMSMAENMKSKINKQKGEDKKILLKNTAYAISRLLSIAVGE